MKGSVASFCILLLSFHISQLSRHFFKLVLPSCWLSCCWLAAVSMRQLRHKNINWQSYSANFRLTHQAIRLTLASVWSLLKGDNLHTNKGNMKPLTVKGAEVAFVTVEFFFQIFPASKVQRTKVVQKISAKSNQWIKSYAHLYILKKW